MLKNYLKIAFRNFSNNKVHSLINILGLSVGMAVAMVIGLWIWSEISFDRRNTNYDRIAIVKRNASDNGVVRTFDNNPYPLGPELRRSYPNDFKYVVSSTRPTQLILASGEKIFMESGAYFDQDGPELIGLKMIYGTRDGLREPGSIMLAESVARAYFGEGDPVNKLMKLDNSMDVKVTGVFEDLPDNSSFADVKFMAPWDLYVSSAGLKTRPHPWRRNSFLVYIQLSEQAKLDDVSRKISRVILQNGGPDEASSNPVLFLYPMRRWHLYSDFKDGVNAGGRIGYVRLFGVIGIIVLLMACINFMNLSTARSEKRAKEVGIRKAIGSLRGQLLYQFFAESVLLALISFVVSIVWALLMLPFFNQLTGKDMHILWGEPLFWLAGIGFALFTGLIAGAYPALYLSSFHPVHVLKGTFKTGKGAALPRKVLVVLQFTSSILLTIGTIVIFKQIKYGQDLPVGYNRRGLVVVPTGTRDIYNHFNAIRDELVNSGAIVQMALSGNSATGIRSENGGFEWRGKDPKLDGGFPTPEISHTYGQTVGWQFVAGRDFSLKLPTDSSSVVINQAAVTYMGLKNPVGEIIRWNGKSYNIIGVIRDMIVESPYEEVRPCIYFITDDPGDFGFVFLRINPASGVHAALEKIETTFKTYNPREPFAFDFADSEYAAKFGEEERIGRLAGAFAILAIFISCLGLLGLASFVAARRTKEIGIRKLLGASVFTLWRLLSREFVLQLMIALLIAVPVAYFTMNHWLQGFHYRTAISWWVFVLTAAGAFLITLSTISYHTIRIALTNPRNALRTE